MKLRRRWVWGVAGMAAVAAVVGVVLWILGPRVAVVVAARREITQAVIVSGRVLPPSRVNVGTLLSGVVTKVAVKEGDHVNAGDLLVQLDDTEAKVAVTVAKARLKEARARLQQLKEITGPVARATHQQADANLAFARLSYERLVAMAKKGGAPAAQVDEAKRALDVAQGQHDATESQAHGSAPKGADHRLALASYAQAAAGVAQAEVHAAESRIVAATAGVVLTRTVEPGELVQPGRTLLVLAIDGKTLLSIQPDEKNLAMLRLGQPARASADAFAQQSFAATLSYIAPSVDPLRGTVEVRFEVVQPPPYLRPDMTVSVDIEVGRRTAALVLPKDAVQEPTSAKPWVWLLLDGHVERRAVELGLRGDSHLEIVRGVREGDRVAVPAGRVLSPRQRVRASQRVGG